MASNRTPLIDGTYGLTLPLPGEWEPLDQGEASGSWMNAKGDMLFIEHPPFPILILDRLLGEYRHDLRLLAARSSGGLVQCDMVDGLGVFGITKRPRPDGPGMNYFLHGLLPTERGHATIILVCPEGPPVGQRSSEVGRRLEADHWSKDSWMKDPYGFDEWEGEPSLFQRLKQGTRYRLAEPSSLRNASDDEEYDAEFPDHPLSRMRRFLKLIEMIGRAEPPRETIRPRGHARLGFTFGLPLGYLPFEEGFLDNGILHRRLTFEDRHALIALRRHPGAAEIGRTASAARLHVGDHVRAGNGRLLWGPDTLPVGVGKREGIRVEYESQTAGRPTVTVAFYFASGGQAMEVSCISDIDDRQRCDRALRQVIPTLKDDLGG